MKELVASLNSNGVGMDISVGEYKFTDVQDAPVLEQVSFVVSGDAGVELDDPMFIGDELAERVINILNGEDGN